jgi:large subunit ribosomal protein L21
MYAVVRTGGKQYKVTKDAVLTVESLAGEIGSKLTLGEVLLLGGDSPKLGAPLVKGASIECEVVEHGQGEKVIAFKKKRRKNTHRKRGHRQHFTKLKVLSISAGKE